MGTFLSKANNTNITVKWDIKDFNENRRENGIFLLKRFKFQKETKNIVNFEKW